MLHTQLYKYLNQRENPSCPSLEIVYSRGESLSLGAVELLLRVSNLFPFCIISRARASPAPWRDFGIACA
jgi:hypothetical protein